METKSDLIASANAMLAMFASEPGFDPGFDPLNFALRILKDTWSDVTWTVAVGGPFGATVIAAE